MRQHAHSPGYAATAPARALLVCPGMRDVRLFILGHLALIAVAIVGNL